MERVKFVAYEDDWKAKELLQMISRCVLDGVAIKTQELTYVMKPGPSEILIHEQVGGVGGVLVAGDILLSSPSGTKNHHYALRQVVISPCDKPRRENRSQDEIVRAVIEACLKHYNDPLVFCVDGGGA